VKKCMAINGDYVEK